MIGQIKFAKRVNDMESALMFQLMTPSADTLFALRLIVGIQRQAEFGQVLDEINAKIADLQAQLAAAGSTNPAVDAATADLKSSVDAALAQFRQLNCAWKSSGSSDFN